MSKIYISLGSRNIFAIEAPGIYIISKDFIFIKVMEAMLNRRFPAHYVFKISSFREFREKLIAESPGMIFMDDYIAGTGSIELITFIRNDRRLECPIYLFCEKVTENVKNSLSLGVNRYFAKPFDMEAIANEIYNDLKSSSGRI
jgi:response regulator of citrate/malate metabolism